MRTLDVRVQVAQVSLAALIIWGLVALADVLGLISYYSFMFRHGRRLDQTPQSKLDWMLQALREEHGEINIRRTLSRATASATCTPDAAPLTKVEEVDSKDSKGMSSSIMKLPATDRDNSLHLVDQVSYHQEAKASR